MNQYMTICKVRGMLSEVLALNPDENLACKLKQIDTELDIFQKNGIDFKEIVDNLDDSVFITDAKGNVLYVNPAYTKNTNVQPDEVLHRNVNELIGEDRVYTGGVVPDVLKNKKSVMRLATTYRTNPPLLGYAYGTPIFSKDGELHLIVACSRPLATLSALQDDFQTFIKEVNQLNIKTITEEGEKNLSPNMIRKSSSLSNIWNLIYHIAPTDATVLITGESGAGKEVVADEIFRNSDRQNAPFVKINCASIPTNLLESELFGYEKGAFSGANPKGKKGLFEVANHGTLMLDEIGDMPMELQVKLLRAIQQQEITRIGGTEPIKLDIRFLALTNSDLKQKIEQGTFRQDLYYRLNVIPIYVPPLRERIQDLEDLCAYFTDKFSKKYNRPFTLTERQLDYMKTYTWPGNIRELENVLEYLVLFSSDNGAIDDTVLMGLLHLSPDSQSYKSVENDFYAAVEQFEKQTLERALKSSGSLREAGEKLHLNASTISRKIKQYHIEYPPSDK